MFMKPFVLSTLLSVSIFALYGCGPRGFATKSAEDCTAFCAQDGQAGTFDAASGSCICSEVAAPPADG